MDWKDILASKLDEMGGVPEEATASEPTAKLPKQSGKLIIDVERKGRAGKTATIISGFTITEEQVSELASQLQRALGCGGSSRGGEILLQGDRRTAATTLLRSKGYKL